MDESTLLASWQPVVAAVGTVLSEDGPPGADPVEPGAIRRWCEPLELGDPVHYDRTVAQAHRWSDVVAPYTATVSFALPRMWAPGDPPLFDEAGPDAQPRFSPVAGIALPGAPSYRGYLATEVSTEFNRPAVAGDVVRKSRVRLVGCVPKRTKLGTGAFVTIETELRNQQDTLLATMTTTFFCYEPGEHDDA
ncbi:MAG: hypothetical protein JWN95_2314 [Frankiales bacterium]|nr:hypothetical protein [Frankiales bacterium]